MKALTSKCFLLLALLLAGCGNIQSSNFQRLSAVRTLFSEERIVHNFSNMRDHFEVIEFELGDTASPIAIGDELSFNSVFNEWQENRNVTAIVVLKDGEIVFENYFLGTTQSDQRISWSVAKSYISVLIGILIERGEIKSIQDLASEYAPELNGTPYEKVTIKDLLQMSSGVVFDENYGRYFSDINRMGRVLALGGSMDEFALEQRPRHSASGERWQYVSIDTHILGIVLRRASGRSLPALMEDYILEPLGTGGAPYYLTDNQGVAFALGGLNLTTRDYARFGEMVRQNGIFQGRRIVPESWILESTRPSANTEAGAFQYGYHWWMAPDARSGEFFAYGVYGQFIYIDRASGIVIAVNSADRKFSQNGVLAEYISGFRAIVANSQKP